LDLLHRGLVDLDTELDVVLHVRVELGHHRLGQLSPQPRFGVGEELQPLALQCLHRGDVAWRRGRALLLDTGKALGDIAQYHPVHGSLRLGESRLRQHRGPSIDVCG
jgi:hypothetical protein